MSQEDLTSEARDAKSVTDTNQGYQANKNINPPTTCGAGDSYSDNEQHCLTRLSHKVTRKRMEMGCFYDRVESVYLTWRNLTYSVRRRDTTKTILSNISGHVGPGEVLGMVWLSYNTQQLSFSVLRCMFCLHSILSLLVFVLLMGCVVILGPSGSGKTSLLSILSGTRKHTCGNIYYQGREKTVTKGSEDIMGFKGNASYVAQDDILQGSLTVEETLVE